MKRIVLLGILSGIFLAGTATTASAVGLLELQPVAGETVSYATGITPDGAWVVGRSSGTTNGYGSLYDVSGDGSAVPFSANGYTALSLTGICYQTVDGQQVLTLGGQTTQGRIGIWTGSGSTWSIQRPADTLGNARTAQSNFNALASDGGTSGYYFSYKYSNTNLQIGYGVGAGPVTFGDYRSGVTDADPRQASASGRIVGRAFSGAGGAGVFSYVDGGANDLIQTVLTGLAGSDQDYAYGIDASGNLIAGSSRVGGVHQPWMADLAGGTTTALPLAAGTDGASYSYGMSADGKYIVGQNHVGGERAALWDVSDANPANWTVTDLTVFASDLGLLGNFTSLDRAYSIGQKPSGELVIAGYGTTSAGTRGFVLTVPEPATVALLGLGFLLLRRRR